MSTMIASFAAWASPVVRPQWSDRGATAVEYAILVSLIAATVVGLVVTLGIQTSTLFQTVQGLF